MKAGNLKLSSFLKFIWIGCFLSGELSWAQAAANAGSMAPVLDNSREVVADKVVGLARNLDSLFGDEKLYDDYESSTLIIEQEAYIREENSWGTGDLSIRLNLKLPQAQKKVDKVGETIVKVGKGVVDGAKSVVDERKDGRGIVTTPKRKRADEDAWKFSQESGLRVANPLYYFFKLRARRNFQAGAFSNSFSEEFGWFTDKYWAESTSLLSDFVISDSVLFRIINEKNWYLSLSEFETVHGFSIYKSLSDQEALSYNARMFTDIEEARFAAKKYTVGLTHSRAINRDWVTLETTPQLVFLREDKFRGYWEILFKLGFAIGRN